jgi:hypothetical protein
MAPLKVKVDGCSCKARSNDWPMRPVMPKIAMGRIALRP